MKVVSTLEDSNLLSSVYFDLDNFKYFTVCRNTEEDNEVYFELNDQMYSGYSKDLNYKLNRNEIHFKFNHELEKALDFNNELIIEFRLDKNDFALLEATLNQINTKPHSLM